MTHVRGKAWVFGDEINTDNMAPGLYFKLPMEEMARHCLEVVDPTFAAGVKPGDIVVGGRNFGVGSAREQAAMAFQYLGVGAILARSFSRIFYRNALNFGVPALVFPHGNEVSAGDELEVDPVAGIVRNVSSNRRYQVSGIPDNVMDMVRAGGLMPWLQRRLGAGQNV